MKEWYDVFKSRMMDIDVRRNASLCVGKKLGRFKKMPAMFSKNIAGFYVSSGGA